MKNPALDHQVLEIKNKLKVEYNIDLEDTYDIDLGKIVSGIVSFKIFIDKIDGIDDHYAKEIISNLNQSSILTFLGFRVASLILLRRCLENVLCSIYYKDHKIEYLKKELDVNKRTFDKIEELLNYFIEFPYKQYFDIEEERLLILLKKIKEEWNATYKKLSNYVHSSNSNYLDLHTFLDDIKFNQDKYLEYIELYKLTITIITSIFVIFYFKEFSNFTPEEKTIIRNSIHNDDLKRKIIEIFGDL